MDHPSDGIIRQESTREVYRNPWLRLREDEVRFPDGSTGIYTVIDKPDFVLVVPYENEGFWLVQQYRYPVGSRQWEFPQGGWPEGHGGSPAELAAAELREETGMRADELRHLGHLFAAYGFCGQAYDVFLATGLTAGEPQREATEADMIHRWFPVDEVYGMLARGEFADGHSVGALTLFAAASRP
jgi:8-oxo-dGTP pyrophosphatase MutT (NUDIX family)